MTRDIETKSAKRNFSLPLVLEVLIMGSQVLSEGLSIGEDTVAALLGAFKEHGR